MSGAGELPPPPFTTAPPPPPPPSPPSPNVREGMVESESGIADCDEVADDCAVELAAAELGPGVTADEFEDKPPSTGRALRIARVLGPTRPTASRPLRIWKAATAAWVSAPK